MPSTQSAGLLPPRNLIRYFGSGHIQTIKNLELRVSNPLNHNDPFESEFPTGGDLTPENVKRLFMSRRHQWNGLFSKIQSKYPNIRTQKALERHFLGNIDHYAKNYINAVESTRLDIAKTGKAVFKKILRVVCLTRVVDEPESIKFWAHYAENSTGARIHFEIPEQELINLKKINYAQHRPVIDLTVDPQSPAGYEAFHKLLTTKDEIWAAEEEYRLFVHPNRCITKDINGKAMDFLKISRDWIKMIDFGHRADAAEMSELIKYLKEERYPITVRRAKMPAGNSRSFSYDCLHAVS